MKLPSHDSICPIAMRISNFAILLCLLIKICQHLPSCITINKTTKMFAEAEILKLIHEEDNVLKLIEHDYSVFVNWERGMW